MLKYSFTFPLLLFFLTNITHADEIKKSNQTVHEIKVCSLVSSGTCFCYGGPSDKKLYFEGSNGAPVNGHSCIWDEQKNPDGTVRPVTLPEYGGDEVLAVIYGYEIGDRFDMVGNYEHPGMLIDFTFKPVPPPSQDGVFYIMSAEGQGHGPYITIYDDSDDFDALTQKEIDQTG